MKKVLFCLLFISVFFSGILAETKTIAVINLHAVNIPESTAVLMSDAIRRELAYFSDIEVISAQEMSILMNDKELTESELWSNPSKAGLYAKMLHCNLIYTGIIEKKDNSYILTFIEINPETNKNEKIIKIEKQMQEEKLYFLAEEAVKTAVFSKKGTIQLISEAELTAPELCFVSKGSFIIGNEKGSKNENVTHKVNITHNFFMSKYEITTAQFCSMLNFANKRNYLQINKKSVKNNIGDSKILIDLNLNDRGIRSSIYYDGKLFHFKQGYENIPISGITWYGAAFYCNILSEKEKLAPLYNLKLWNAVLFNHKGYRLPTEAEWEFAARGARNTKNYKFSGSDNFNEVAWLKGNGDNRLHQTGLLKPNELNIFDLTGNANEWCNDFFNAKYYQTAEVTNPEGPSYTAYHSVRGGSFKTTEKQSFIYSRNYFNSEKASASTGFRPVLIIP